MFDNSYQQIYLNNFTKNGGVFGNIENLTLNIFLKVYLEKK